MYNDGPYGFSLVPDEDVQEVPFSYELPESAHPHLDFIIRGMVDKKAFRFAINLISKREDTTDLVFHFNPRFDQRYSACNSQFNSKWGFEEHSSHQKFPFQRGKPFVVEIFLTHSEFLVAVNGAHYCSYTYRTSLLNITNLIIEGAVTLSHVHLQYTSSYPSPLPIEYPRCPYIFPLHEGTTINETQITPVYGYLQGKLRSGSEIEINGKVQLLPHAFYINLQEGSHVWPHPEVPLHMSVRFIFGDDEIRTNTWTKSSWGREERVENCLLTPGYNFALKVICKSDSFIVQVNNKLQLSFKHRVPFTNIDTLHIQGDVFVYDISIHL